MPAPASGPRSVDRALDILDAVADADRPVTAKALARRLGCSLSTVYHLLGPLTGRGHLTRTGEGYVPGPRAVALHRSFQRQLGAGPGAAELLRRVRETAGLPAYLTVYRDGRITMIDSTTPATAQDDPFVPGPEVRAHATAHGKMLLAQLPRAVRHRYLDSHGMARLTERTITGAERFEAELVRVRGDGVAVSIGEADPAYACLAVPLTPPGDGGPGRVAHALSVSLPAEDFPRRHGEVRAVLTREAARSVSGGPCP
ncbi:IclR family transcriptional regulator [Streptomyces sp. NEAU-Y11]|uniref:IclR family transcriptional regulator n=1 Tax=Streptomyces cucumeris TaxID=2962890 RepID=UPI0020C8F358|nr:IclR family transcriptional regulator C-terminal domain-containing protein [Streptomyces sp. NEAU-Y11]MCP9212537.1 helix-turn-helix domain-containing protein [Streptomyces sp. NEAU-Y11]